MTAILISVFGGNRAREWERRLEGVFVQTDSREGGGILSARLATRNATTAQLETDAQARLNRMIDQGVTTVEVKSGYGLDLPNEMRMLEVAGVFLSWGSQFRLRY